MRKECAQCRRPMDMVFAPIEIRILHVSWTINGIPVWMCPGCGSIIVDYVPTEFDPVMEEEHSR